MSDILSKIRLSGVTYDIVDETALHTLDSTVTSGGTNAVDGSAVYNAITASSAAVLETVGQAGYQTATDVENAISGKADTSAVTEAIDAAVSGKADTSAVTEAIDAAVSGKADTSALTEFFGEVEYDSNTKHINFYNTTTAGTVLAYIDATDFIKDGMVDNVEIKDVTISGETVTCLAITFNSDSGKEEIDIPLTDIFDPSNYYTKSQIDTTVSGLTARMGEDEEVTAAALNDLNEAVSGKVDTTTFNTYSGSVATALAGKQATLVSGTNIKTINNESLLGSGNISIQAGNQVEVSGTTLVFL